MSTTHCENKDFIYYYMTISSLTFNKIAISNNKFQMASGQGSHWLIESPIMLSSMYSPLLSDICLFYFLNIFTLLALTQSFDNLLFSFITLCENEYFLMSNLHCSLTNAALCPLVLLPLLSLKNIFPSISSQPFTILNTYIWTPLSLLVSSVVKPHSNKRLS